MEIETSSSSTKNNEKIGKVLQKFLQPNFTIRNDFYFNQFLTHLVGKNDDGEVWETSKDLKEHYCQWLIIASSLWGRRKVKPLDTILSFALNLASRLSADEELFFKLNSKNVYESLVGLAKTNSVNDPSVTLGLVSLLCSFLEHKSGLQWVMATTHWADMINLGLNARDTYIRKKAYQFVVKLLEEAINLNRNFSIIVMVILIKPLKEVLRSLPYDENTRHTVFDSWELFACLKPSLNLILEVIETLLKKFNRKVFHLFFKIEAPKTIEKLLFLSRSEDFSFELLRIQFVFLFYEMCLKIDGLKVVDYDSFTLFEVRTMFNLITIEINKGNLRCAVKISNYAHDLLCYLEPRLPKCFQKENAIELPTQFLFTILGPIYGFSSQILSEDRAASLMFYDAFRTDYFARCLKMTAVQNTKMCYKWVQRLKSKPDLVDDVFFCFQIFSKMKKVLTKERAALIFSSLIYLLNDVTVGLTETPDIELSLSYLLFSKTLVELIVDFVESFDLTWKDGVEAIRVMDLAYDFLQYSHWTENIVSVGLRLLNTAISKCMSPDMALLIFHQEDAKVFQTRSLLVAKCHDSSWEIRDNALEVVNTLSLNAKTKFPAYTSILLNAALPQLVVNMALKDVEYYVRATAFKCLREMIQIPEIWDTCLNTDNFLDNMLDVFENETEGIVRKEAAALIYKIDEIQNFPDKTLPRLYDVMSHAAIEDVNWEVKYNALDFWINVWERHLTYQGMLDHRFPSHTFSKELKKIVALNEAEVRKRIIKVLNQLSHIGGLHVMKCAVQDDSDIEVSKKATFFTSKILKMFKKYQISIENVDLSQPPSPARPPENLPDQQPISPADSPETSAPYPAKMKSSGSPQFSNSPFFEPVSPFTPISPSAYPDVITPLTSTISQSSILKNSPQESHTPCGNSVYTHKDIADDSVNSRTQHDTPVNNTSPDQITSNIDLISLTDVMGYDEASMDSVQLENMFSNSPFFDPVSPCAPPSPSNDLGTLPSMSTVSQSSNIENHQQSQTSYQNSVHEQKVPLQNTISSRTQHDMASNNTSSNQIPSKVNLTDVLGYDEGSMDSDQADRFSNSPFFDPVSPFAPLSPSNDLGERQLSSTVSQSSICQNSSQKSQTPYENTVHQQGVPVEDTIGSRTQSDTSSNQIPSCVNLTNVTNVLGYDEGSMDSAQEDNRFSNSPFFDPVSPFAPLSPSNDLTVTPSTSTVLQPSAFQNSPRQSRQQKVPVPDSMRLRKQPVQNPSSVNLTNVTDVLGYDDGSMDSVQLENLIKSNNFDPLQTELILDEFLNSNDMTFLQEINPIEQVAAQVTTERKTKTYLAPSQYLEFVFNEIKTNAMEKAQSLNSLDEFDSLLDGILKEYDFVEDVIVMDCY